MKFIKHKKLIVGVLIALFLVLVLAVPLFEKKEGICPTSQNGITTQTVCYIKRISLLQKLIER